jgi:5-formyltetrahydrofolate cyclo-ligase
MSIVSDKNILRGKYKGIRKSYSEEYKSNLDGLLLKNLTQHLDFNSYSAILCYVSFGIEVDTLKLIHYLRDNNIPTYAPKCYKNDSSMRFFAINSVDSLTYGEYKGILEPKEDPSTELTDFNNCLCVVPALSFDKQGYRLGWGGGYYDRFLSANPSVHTVGLTYSACMAETLPKDGYDISVDLVVTENNIITCGGTNEY